MTIVPFFTDPRRQRSEDLAFFAERAEHAGDLHAAISQYAEAAKLEEANAHDVPGEVPRVRSVLAISAVTLWLRAKRWEDAARAGCAFLAEPDKLASDALRELQSLVDRARQSEAAERGRDQEKAMNREDMTKRLKNGVRDLGGNVRPTKTVGRKLVEPPKQSREKLICYHLSIRDDGWHLVCNLCGDVVD